MRRPLAAVLAAAILAVPVSACTADKARKNATPTSAANAEAQVALRRLKDVGLLSPSKVPGDYEQVAKVNFTDFTACGTNPLQKTPPSGRLATAYGNSRENLIAQSIFVFADEATATAYFNDVTATLTSCGRYEAAGFGFNASPQPSALPEASLADQSATYATSNATRNGTKFTGTLTILREGKVVTQISTFTLNEPGLQPDALGQMLKAAAKAIRTANGPDVSPSSAPN